MSATPIVLDTDIGTDVDDALALLFALASPEVELVGLTVVDGDVDLRARVAARLLGMAGRPDVPVFKGHARPMGPAGLGPTMLGHEGEGILDIPYDGPESAISDIPASEWLVEESTHRSFHLVAIGPLTNVGRALRLDPLLAERLPGLTVMGGVLSEDRLPAAWREGLYRAGLPLAWPDHNTHSDPTAALVCALSGLPVAWVTAETTFATPMHRWGRERLSVAGGRLADSLIRMLDAWYPGLHEPLSPHEVPSPVPEDVVAYLHDPLALSALFAGDWLKLREVRLEYRIEGELFRLREISESNGTTARVSVGVDGRKFEALFLDRIERFLREISGGEA